MYLNNNIIIQSLAAIMLTAAAHAACQAQASEAPDDEAESAEEAAEAAEAAAEEAAEAASEDAIEDSSDFEEMDDPADAADDSMDDWATEDFDDRDSRDRDAADEESADDKNEDADGERGESETDAPGDGEASPFLVEIDENDDEVVANEILALVADPDEVKALRAAGFQLQTDETLTGLGLQLVSIKAGPSGAKELIERLRNTTPQSLFTRNHLFTAGISGRSAAPPEPRSAPPVKRLGVVGLIDGAVNPQSIDREIGLRIVNFGTAASAISHGSAVASRLSDTGVKDIYSANIFSGRKAPAAALLRALDWMAQRNVAVINISLAGAENQLVNHAIGILLDRGHVVVAAVGNNGPAAPPLYPSALPGVIAVTAVDRKGHVYRRANRGAHVAFAAPGVDVPTRDGVGQTQVSSGTSFAAPVVSARIARSLQQPDTDQRRRSIEGLVKAAHDRGEPGRDSVYGHGVVY